MIIVLVLFRGNKKITAIIYLLIAIGTTVDPANISDYSGAIFFIFSYHLIKNNKYAIIILVSTITAVTTRALLASDTIPQAFMMIAIFGYIYAIYYYLILNNNAKIEKEAYTKVCFGNNSLNANPINVRIMQLRVLGYEWNKINDILRLNVTDQTICTRISRERKKLGFRSQEEYLYWLMSDTCKNSRINDNDNDSENKYDMIN
jgi:hypothetical protein